MISDGRDGNVSTGKGLLNQIRQNGIVKDPQGKALKNYDGTDMRYQDLWREFTLNGGGFSGAVGNNKVGNIQAVLAGIAAGVIDIPKGAFSQARH